MPVLKAVVHIIYSIGDLLVFPTIERQQIKQQDYAGFHVRKTWIQFWVLFQTIWALRKITEAESIFSSVTIPSSHLVVFKVLLVLFDGFKERWILETKVHRTLRIRILATITIYLVQFLKPPSCGKLKQEHWWQQHCRAPKGFRFLLSFFILL